MRDPIARNISLFFELSDAKGITHDHVSEAQQDDYIDGLIQQFVHEFNHKKYASWFDLHLHQPFGVDIFKV
jgi:hypothetical protein